VTFSHGAAGTRGPQVLGTRATVLAFLAFSLAYFLSALLRGWPARTSSASR
jgi:hypothetical protein